MKEFLIEDSSIRFTPLDLNEFDLDIKISDIDYCNGYIENHTEWTCLTCHEINPKMNGDAMLTNCSKCKSLRSFYTNTELLR
jgi:hypothetical protein